jgi:hypothetical protein
MEKIALIDDYHVVCDICNENLGDYRMNFAQEHLKKHPHHNKYNVKIKDRLNY